MARNFSELKKGFESVTNWLEKEYGQLHTGRATPMVLDSIMIEQYGSFTPIKNVGSIAVEDAKTLRVMPWDKSLIKEIEKAIGTANLGLSLAVDDQGIRVIFPMLTQENREKLVKMLKAKLEDARISVRKERDEERDRIESEELPQDADYAAKEDLQKLTNEVNAKLELIFEKKQKEVLGN